MSLTARTRVHEGSQVYCNTNTSTPSSPKFQILMCHTLYASTVYYNLLIQLTPALPLCADPYNDALSVRIDCWWLLEQPLGQASPFLVMEVARTVPQQEGKLWSTTHVFSFSINLGSLLKCILVFTCTQVVPLLHVVRRSPYMTVVLSCTVRFLYPHTTVSAFFFFRFSFHPPPPLSRDESIV